MILYIIRHGETEWNTRLKLQGQTDIPLNENGRALAVKTGRALQKIPFDLAITSPLSRARETARLVLGGRAEEDPALRNWKRDALTGRENDALQIQAVQAHTIPVFTDERLREISFGCLEGHTVKKENGRFVNPQELADFFNAPQRYQAPPDGESLAELLARTGAFLADLERQAAWANKTILVSTHGAALRALLANIRRSSLEDFWSGSVPKNCSVSIAEFSLKENWKIKEQDILYYEHENI